MKDNVDLMAEEASMLVDWLKVSVLSTKDGALASSQSSPAPLPVEQRQVSFVEQLSSLVVIAVVLFAISCIPWDGVPISLATAFTLGRFLGIGRV